MLLEKYENLFEWSVKHLVIQSSLTTSIFLGQSLCVCVWKTKNVNVVCSNISYFFISNRIVIQVQILSNSFEKSMINPSHHPKGLSKSFPANYSKK